MPRTARRVLRARVLLPLLVGVAGAAVALSSGPGGPPAGSAADRFVAGQLTTVREPVVGAPAKALDRRAGVNRAAIGSGTPASVKMQHVRNRFSGLTYDEVVDTDGKGRALALQRFDASGRLLAAVRFGGHNPKKAVVADAAGARKAALGHARALGLDPTGSPRVRRGATAEWIVEWPRLVDGIPVPGDGVVVRTWADGSIHTAVRTERTLAARPERPLSVAEARRLGRERLAGWLDARHAGEWQIDDVSLAWVAPNDTFEATAPDAPASVLRLAWVVRVTTSGGLAEAVRGMELYLDAGDGRLLGGDVLR
ncbi:MAG: hypothetical protein H6Q36_1157 [Chloroflexi bacterium]|nr:hypothetical protein [Chloroflexota bacterium]